MSLVTILFIVLVVLILAGGIYWFTRNPTVPVVPTATGVEPLANPAIDSHGVPTVPGLGANDGSTPPTA